MNLDDEVLAPPTGLRPLPQLTATNTPFWTSGFAGRLVLARCPDCTYYVHPPLRVCPRCRGTRVDFEAVSGRGTLHSFTVNTHEWYPTIPQPYVIALVEPVEQPGLRIGTGMVNCTVGDLRIGMGVQVVFVEIDDVALPYFEPVPGDG